MSSCLQDCQAWADINLHMSSTSNDAVKLFDSALTQYVTWTEDDSLGGIEGTCTKMLGADSKFIMGNVLALGLELMATGKTIRQDQTFAKSFTDLNLNCAEKGNEREKLHCQAVTAWAHDQYSEACNTWESILQQFPNDLLALKFAHDGYFYLGNSEMIRDSVGRVLPSWSRSNKFYGYIRGMQAFGLEETNMYEMASAAATEALALNPTDCWATHANAHCFEMKGRQKEGIDFLESTESDWSRGKMLACHNYWHLALYYLELGLHSKVLDIYDGEVGERCQSGAMLDVVDAASLLQRLEFDGVNVGNRWHDLVEIARPHIDDHVMAFNDLHFLMAFLGDRSSGTLAESFIASVESYLETSLDTTNKKIFSDLGLPIMNALVSYKEERYGDAVELLLPLKYQVQHIGGSHAQRDVFNQLLIKSCIRSSEPKHCMVGKALLSERKSLKENSPLTDRLYAKMMSCHESNVLH